MIQILKDDLLNEELDVDGFVVVPFLQKEGIQKLTDLFYTYHKEEKKGFYASSHLTDIPLKNLLNDAILEQMKPAIDQFFHDCNPLGGSYIVKYPGDNGSLDPHQDWSIVDEENFKSFNIWIPLVDTNEENGAISVLPKSHTLTKSIRGVNIPDPFQSIKEYTWTLHQPLYMKAGEALIYDHRLLHASKVNHSQHPRLAVVFGIMPNKAEMRYYYAENNMISEYKCNAHFFLNENIIDGPKNLHLLRTIEPNNESYTIEQFNHLYFGYDPLAEPTSLWKKIVQFFQ